MSHNLLLLLTLVLLSTHLIAAEPKSIFWKFPGYFDSPGTRGRDVDFRAGFRTRPVSLIHKGDWKLHLFYEEWGLDGGREKLATNHAVELYNLIDDIGERNDLSNINAEKRDELLDELLAWQKSVQAPIPSERNPDYAPGTRSTDKGRAKGIRAQSDDEP